MGRCLCRDNILLQVKVTTDTADMTSPEGEISRRIGGFAFVDYGEVPDTRRRRGKSDYECMGHETGAFRCASLISSG